MSKTIPSANPIFVLDRKNFSGVKIAPDMKTAYNLGNAYIVVREEEDLKHLSLQDLTLCYNELKAGVPKKDFEERSAPMRHIWRALLDQKGNFPMIETGTGGNPGPAVKKVPTGMTASKEKAMAEKAEKTKKATPAKATKEKPAKTAKTAKTAKATDEGGGEKPKAGRTKGPRIGTIARAWPKAFELKDQTLVALVKENPYSGARAEQLAKVFEAGAKGIKFEALKEAGASMHNIGLAVERGIIGIK